MMVCDSISLIGIVRTLVIRVFFTATSFIGMIALAGESMVRNPVLLIDFIEIRLNEGIPWEQAIIEAGAVRTTPLY